jgi:hypothetical protein
MRRLVLWVASRLAARYGCRLVHAEMYDDAVANVDALREYSLRSGHLTRGFKAGRMVQGSLLYIGGVLRCGALSW